MSTTATPSPLIRKSAHTIRKPNCMHDDVATPNSIGVEIPLAHDLMTFERPICTVKSRNNRVVEVKCTTPLPCTDHVSTKDEESISSTSDESK